MSITQLTVADIRLLQKLLEKKEELQRRIDEINAELEGIGGNNGSTGGYGGGRRRRKPRRVATVRIKGKGKGKAAAKGKKSKSGGGRKGVLKGKITAALKAAGKEGMHVKELAKVVKWPVPNIRVWFHATGKKIEEIKKVGPAKYAWVG